MHYLHLLQHHTQSRKLAFFLYLCLNLVHCSSFRVGDNKTVEIFQQNCFLQQCGGTLFFFLCVLISADGRKRDCLEFVCKFVYKIHEHHHHAQQFAILHRESHRCFGSSCICGQCTSFGGNLEEHYPSPNKLLHFDCRTGLN